MKEVMEPQPAHLVLADGTIFEGEHLGALQPGGIATGEIVFNTTLTGYQEVLTDPSYAGQIVSFTYPHIGNYGVNATDFESIGMFCRGVVVRDLSRRTSNWRAEHSLSTMLNAAGISGIGGVDTRKLTRRIRQYGAMGAAFGTADIALLTQAARTEPGTVGVDLVSTVTTPDRYRVGEGPRRVVALDFGIKRNILRHLAKIATVDVLPASVTAEEILSLQPDGIFLSNGPGDPTMVTHAPAMIQNLLESGVPLFGICLGHQLLSTALGASTYKLPFGHHGGNHPVRHLASGVVEITSQNHNYCVDVAGLNDVEVTHLNLNDGTNEGIRSLRYRAYSVQHHPEAGPGPHDSAYLFDQFAQLIDDPSTFNQNRSVAFHVPDPFRTPEPVGLPVATPGFTQGGDQ